jgi:hypothetical protein
MLLRLGDWRDGEASAKLELREAAVCMLEDEVPDLAGILAPQWWLRQDSGC